MTSSSGRGARPGPGSIDAVRRENAELREELRRIRSSRSYRFGNAVMRAVARVVPGRRPGPSPRREAGAGGPPGPSPAGTTGADETPSSPDPGPTPLHRIGPPDERVPAPRSPADLLVDAQGLDPADLAGAVERWRGDLPDHARLLVVHEAVDRLDGLRAVPVAPDADLKAVRARFGPHRTAKAAHGLRLEGASQRAPRRPTVRPSTPADEPGRGVPPGPVFVGGTGRSGTWMVGRMLRHHPSWTTVHTELRFHAVPNGYPAVLEGRVDPARFAEQVSTRWFRVFGGGGGDPKGLQMILAHHELVGALRRFRRQARTDLPAALGELLLEVVEPYARGRGAAGWTETTPYNASAAHALLTALPQARLVHTVRDGRDVASSLVGMPWGPETIEEGLDWWAERFLRASLGVDAADPARVHVVRLEELAHFEREERYAELLAFLGFESDAGIRRFFDERISSDAGNLGRWRGSVDGRQRDRVDGRYRELLAELRDRGVTRLPTDPDRVREAAG